MSVVSRYFGTQEAGRAIVTVVDASGNPVNGATVTGTWSGRVSETDSGTTDSSGQATITSSYKSSGTYTYTFTTWVQQS
jgi:hypothetical protein